MTQHPPLVSIILPTFNRAEFLLKSIRSVVDQSFQNWELIIWDDGSSDETRKVVESFYDKKILYFFDSNHGAAYARDRALEKSNGKFIAFLDSDDEWLPTKLSLQLAVMEENPDIDLLFSNFENINLKKGSSEIAFNEYAGALNRLRIDERQNNIKGIQGNLLETLAACNFIATDTVTMKREIFDQYSGFNENLRNSHDFELWWRLALAGLRFAYTDEVLMKRYKPPGSLSSPGLQSAQNTIKALDLCVKHAISAGRADLIPLLNAKYRNAWQHLIQIYGASGQRQEAVNSFVTSLKYGFRLGSVKMLFKTFLGIQ